MYNMSLYQSQAMRTAGKYDDLNEQMKCATFGIAGESGEFCDNIKKIYYHNKKISDDELMKELGDIMWYIALFCDAKGWSMNTILSLNIEKLKKRYPEGFTVQAANAPRVE